MAWLQVWRCKQSFLASCSNAGFAREGLGPVGRLPWWSVCTGEVRRYLLLRFFLLGLLYDARTCERKWSYRRNDKGNSKKRTYCCFVCYFVVIGTCSWVCQPLFVTFTLVDTKTRLSAASIWHGLSGLWLMMTKRSDVRLNIACYLLDNGKNDSKLASSYLLIDCLWIHSPTAISLHANCDRAVCFR